MKYRTAKIFRYMYSIFFWYLILPSQYVLAASKTLNLDTAVEPEAFEMPSMLGLFFRLSFSLLFIAGFAYITMKILRKNMKVLSSGVNIRVLDQYSFSMNKGVYITQIAGKTYVLGVTDNNINLITEITDQDTIDEIVDKAREKDMEPIIPPGIMQRILPGVFKENSPGGNFSKHIQRQIKKLESLVDNRANVSRGDDNNEQ